MAYLYEEAEKFIKDIFWSESHDKNNNLNIPAIVGERLIKDNSEKDPDYYTHREGVVHVTSLSKCLRGVVLEMLGAKKDNPPDTRKLGVFKAGNLFEDYIVEALGDKMQDRQTEYVYRHENGVILTGRDDGTILHDGVRRVLENKSVHSDSFWYREKEGTLVASHNQAQIQTYLWLRRILPNFFYIQRMVDGKRETEVIYTNLSVEELITFRNKGEVIEQIGIGEKPDSSELNGIFCYISKDDCTISQAPVKFNQRIIDEVVIPALDIVGQNYKNKTPQNVPVPAMVILSEAKHQYQKNWLCTYCDYHNQCVGSGWLLEANAEITRKNKDLQNTMVNKFANVAKPTIQVAPDTGVKVETPDAVSIISQ